MSEFVEVKTAELGGEALDWAVGYAVREHDQDSRDAWAHDWLRCYTPSTDWADGGPLISRYLMDFSCDHPETIGAALCDENGIYLDEHMAYGRTHLIAACRAIVAHKLGDTVSVPKELLP